MMKATYDLISDQWNSNRSELPAPDKQLFDLFTRTLPKKSDILDLGCGAGFPIATHLSTLGFGITGVDRSQNLLNFAQSRLPLSKFINCDVEDFIFQQKYQGIVLWDILFHLSRSTHKNLLTRIFDNLEKKGLLLISSGGSTIDIPAFTDFMYGVEFSYDSHTIEQFKDLIKTVGFVITSETILNKADGDRDKGRIGFVLQKP